MQLNSFESLARSCLYNWLGYGNLNGEVWFVGTEEGGAEIWRLATQTLEQSLMKRSKFSITMDFRNVWEDMYEIPLETFKGANVWRYMSAFLLSLEETSPNTTNTSNYGFGSKKLGRLDSNHFMCELLPLPKRKKDSIDDYITIWKSVKDYHNEVIPKRFELIRNTLIKCNSIKIIVSYEKLLTEQMLAYFSSKVERLEEWNHSNERYSLYKIILTSNKAVYLLATPFFGNGQISYGGLEIAAKKIRNQNILD